MDSSPLQILKPRHPPLLHRIQWPHNLLYQSQSFRSAHGAWYSVVRVTSRSRLNDLDHRRVNLNFQRVHYQNRYTRNNNVCEVHAGLSAMDLLTSVEGSENSEYFFVFTAPRAQQNACSGATTISILNWRHTIKKVK